MTLETTADITSSNPLHKLNWNLRYHLRRLSKLALDASTAEFNQYGFESNLQEAQGLYNQLAFHQMNHEISAELDTRAFNRLFNAVALTALAS